MQPLPYEVLTTTLGLRQSNAYMSTWEKLNDGVFSTDDTRARWLGMGGARAAHVPHTVSAAHLNRTLVSPILLTAWQTWRILWNVYCTIHEHVWRNLIRRTCSFQNWVYHRWTKSESENNSQSSLKIFRYILSVTKPFWTFLGANQDGVLRSRRTSLTHIPIAVGRGGAP